MPYEFSWLRPDTSTSTGSNGTMGAAYTRPFKCIVTEPNPETITSTDVIHQPWLPRINQSCWTDGNLVEPYAICSSITATRHDRRIDLWNGTVQYTMVPFLNVGGRGMAPVAKAINPDSYAAVWEPMWNQMEEVLYEDLGSPPKKCRLPTGTYFTEPFMEKYPQESYRVTQLEEAVSITLVFQRMFSVNDADFKGSPPGYWKIDQMNVRRVYVDTTIGETSAWLCQYMLHKNPRREWWDRRALFDTHYFDSLGNKKRIPFIDDRVLQFIEGMTDQDGLKLPDQFGLPEYETYKDLQETDYTFLERSVRNGVDLLA